MKRDLFIGLAVSGLIHAGFLFGLDDGGADEEDVVDTVPTIELIDMPVIEPEPPEEVVASDEAEQMPLEFAPPMQADVPSTVTVNSFVQPMQPPPPPTATISKSAVTIPVNRTPPTSRLSNIFDISDLDQIPEATYQMQPAYPYELKQQGVTGKVVLGFVVDASGNVRDIYVVSSTNAGFEQSAIQALERWRFRPGRKSGKAVATRMNQPFNFTLQSGR